MQISTILALLNSEYQELSARTHFGHKVDSKALESGETKSKTKFNKLAN